jgi:hypothetical protein
MRLVSTVANLAKLLVSDELTQQKLADETGVILDVDSLQVFSLNETGMFLVEAMKAGVATRDGLVESLVAEFEVDGETAARDVDEFVGELEKYLIERRKPR